MPHILVTTIGLIVLAVTPADGAAPPSGDRRRIERIVQVIKELEQAFEERPSVVSFPLDWAYLAECYRALGKDAKVADINARLDAEDADADGAEPRCQALCRRARRMSERNNDEARRLVGEAEVLFATLEREDQLRAQSLLEYAYLEVGEYRKAIDHVQEFNKDNSCSTKFFNYMSLGHSLLKRRATEPLSEIRQLIRELKPQESELLDGGDRRTEAARTWALACVGLPDEAAENFKRYPHYRPFYGSEKYRMDTTSMQDIIAAYVAQNEKEKALEFLRRYQELVPAEQQPGMSVTAAIAGDFDLATSFAMSAESDAFRASRLSSLVILAHRAGDKARRDDLLKHCREAYKATSRVPPNSDRFDADAELAILEAALGRFEPLERIIPERKGEEADWLRLYLLMTLIDDIMRAKHPGEPTMFDYQFGLVN